MPPKICERIDQERNSAEIYDKIYNKWIKVTVETCEKGEKEKTYEIYKSMVLELKKTYLAIGD